MEQIQQHEWVKAIQEQNIHFCTYCKCKRELDGNRHYIYQDDGAVDWGPIKPACITRYPEQEDIEPPEDYMTWCQYCKIEIMSSRLVDNEHEHFICEKCYNKTT